MLSMLDGSGGGGIRTREAVPTVCGPGMPWPLLRRLVSTTHPPLRYLAYLLFPSDQSERIWRGSFEPVFSFCQPREIRHKRLLVDFLTELRIDAFDHFVDVQRSAVLRNDSFSPRHRTLPTALALFPADSLADSQTRSSLRLRLPSRLASRSGTVCGSGFAVTEQQPAYVVEFRLQLGNLRLLLLDQREKVIRGHVRDYTIVCVITARPFPASSERLNPCGIHARNHLGLR